MDKEKYERFLKETGNERIGWDFLIYMDWRLFFKRVGLCLLQALWILPLIGFFIEWNFGWLILVGIFGFGPVCYILFSWNTPPGECYTEKLERKGIDIRDIINEAHEGIFGDDKEP